VGFLSGSGWGLLLTLLVGALLNSGIVLGALALRRHSAEREALREQWQRELRHLASWGSEEGILRKAGLIHDLSTLKTSGLALGQMLLSGADLRGCHLAHADLRGADLKGVNLQGAVLDHADLSGADLTEANLAMVSLAGAMLRGCALQGANLSKSEMAGANLARANLVNANVHGVDLAATTLDRTRFALREASNFAAEVHPSVEDWIRERLDGRGYYVETVENATLNDASPVESEARMDGLEN
jgi:uncharacterized protein YjbI with pentapeptide repeats